MFKKIVAKIRRLKKHFSRNGGENDSEQNVELNDKAYSAEFKQLMQRFEAIIGLSEDESSLIQSINGHISEHANLYQNIGYQHGKKGTRDYNISKTAIPQATQITEHINSILEGRKKAIEYAIGEKKSRLLVLSTNSNQNMEELKDKNSLKNNDFKQFDLWLGSIYIFFGVAMILADIAVSINFVGFFGIGHMKKADTFNTKIHDWELLLFSLGIAFCTIYVKMLYDEYINSKLGLRQEEIKIALSKGLSKAAIHTEAIVKIVVKLTILFGLLFLLYYLAKYRTYFSIISGMIMLPDDISVSDYTNIKTILLNCFIGISVVIPVISGIALSMGLKIWAQRQTLANSTKFQKSMEKQITAEEDIIKEMTFRITQFEFHLLEWGKVSHKIEIISGLFVQRYNQGFRIGYRENFDNDMYIIIEEYRNEYVNKIMSKQIQ